MARSGATLTQVLAQIRQRESHNDYGITPQENYNYNRRDALHSSANGAYQFQPATWRLYARAMEQAHPELAGVATQYALAYQAPPAVQDAVAAYAVLHGPGINSSALWGASAPPGGYPSVAIADTSPVALATQGGAEPAAVLPTYPTGETIAPGYTIPAAGPFIEDAGAATNTLTGNVPPADVLGIGPPASQGAMGKSLPQQGTLTQADLNADPNSRLSYGEQRDQFAQRYAGISWPQLRPEEQQALSAQFGAAAPVKYEEMRAGLNPPVFPDMGAGSFAGGYGSFTQPEQPLFNGQPIGGELSGIVPFQNTGSEQPLFNGQPIGGELSGIVHFPGETSGPTGFGSFAPPGSLSDFVANGPMTARPPEQPLFNGQPISDQTLSGIMPLQVHSTPASSYVPPTPVPIQPYTTQSPAAGAAAASGLQDYQLPMGSTDPNDPWANQMPEVASPAATIAPAAPAGGLGSLIHHAVQTVSHVLKTGVLPNGQALPSLADLTGIKGFGGGPLPAGVTGQSGLASFLGGQSWHAPDFNSSSGGSTYTYFSPSSPGGIGGYISHNGTLFTYPTAATIYDSGEVTG